MDWLSLKSGSDVRGTAAGEGIVLTPEVAKKLGAAFTEMLAERNGKTVRDIRVSLGRDSRITGEKLLDAAAEGIASTGAEAIRFGMCTTPAMYMSTITKGFEPDGAIMITASHHPWNKNGLKFFTREGGIEGNDVKQLLTMAAETDKRNTTVAASGNITEKAFLPVYIQQLADRIRTGLMTDAAKPLAGLHVAVDAGNGAGGFYASMLDSLGADISGSQFLEPDGMFPNHIPNPENKDAMASLRSAVLNAGADLGVIFDADCDRAAVVDADGKEINRNRLIALISAILLEENPGQTIVTDSVTSSGLKQFIEAHGGTHYRFKRGYRNVIDEAVRLNREGILCPLAIETSGHAALKENHFLDDGMYLVTVLIVKAMEMKKQGLHLGALIADLREPAEAAEIRLAITEPDFRTKGREVIETVTNYAECNPDWHIAQDNREGIRISFNLNGQPDTGWFLLRLSVHDPVMPLNAESDVEGGVRKMLADLYEVLSHVKGICLDDLKKTAEEV
jgi:phosphomannomutase